jgi:hypothetical protein
MATQTAHDDDDHHENDADDDDSGGGSGGGWLCVKWKLLFIYFLLQIEFFSSPFFFSLVLFHVACLNPAFSNSSSSSIRMRWRRQEKEKLSILRERRGASKLSHITGGSFTFSSHSAAFTPHTAHSRPPTPNIREPET